MSSPVDDVEDLDELVILKVAKVRAQHVDFDLLLHVAVDAHQPVLELLTDVAPVEALLQVTALLTYRGWYKPYEGLSSANPIGRKLGVFGRKLEGSHSMFYFYFDIY